MNVTVEDEASFSLEPGVALPPLADAKLGLTATPAPPVVMRSVHYDTEDLRLAAAGITLRRRTRPGASSWDLKVPTRPGDTTVRREVSVADRRTTPPPRLVEVLRAWLDGDPLVAVATLRSRRLTWSVVDAEGTEVAEVVDDEVEHVVGRAVTARFREVEIERRGVPEAYVERVARRLRKAGAEPDPVTKLARVLPLPPAEPAPRVRRSAPVSVLLAASLRKAGDALLAADVGFRLGEPDSVHQLRVACRRMRSDLRAYGAALDPAWREHLTGELAWLGRSLGAARDAEVVADRLAASAADLGPEAAPVVTDLVLRVARANDAVTEALADPRYLALARLLRTGLGDVAGSGGPPARDAVAEAVEGAWRSVERDVRRLRRRGGTDAAWHAVRISAKRGRYVAESATAVAGPAAKRLARAGEAIQDVLGTFHDATMSIAALLELAGERPEDGAYGLVAGRLVERERAAADAARAGLAPVWRDVAEPALRAWRRR